MDVNRVIKTNGDIFKVGELCFAWYPINKFSGHELELYYCEIVDTRGQYEWQCTCKLFFGNESPTHLKGTFNDVCIEDLSKLPDEDKETVAHEELAVTYIKKFIKDKGYSYHFRPEDKEEQIKNCWTWEKDKSCFEYRYPNLSFFNLEPDKGYSIPVPKDYSKFELLLTTLEKVIL